MKSWFVIILAIVAFIAVSVAALLDLKEEADRARALAAEQALYAECRSALDRGDRWQISASCAVEVKTLVAEFDAMEVRAVAAEEQLGALRDDEADGLERAEGRGIQQEERRRHAANTIESAPRDSDGFVHLDAERLRELAHGPGPG